jgi:hypothetical protein
MAGAVQAVQAAQAASEGWLSMPWIIWAGVLSAGVASFASWLTSKASAANSLEMLRKQHAHDLSEASRQREHDAKQKDEDRKGAIRREVYTEAVERAHGLLASIGGLPQRAVEITDDGDALQAFLKANAKIWLVAEAEAAHLSRDLATEFSELFLHALAASMPARHAMEPVRTLARQVEHDDSELLRLQRQYNDARNKNAPQVEQEHLADMLSEAHGWLEELKRNKGEKHAEAAPALFKAFEATFGEMRAVQRLLCKLVSALRAELNLPRDDDEFLAQLREMERRAWVAMNQAIGNSPPVAMPEIVEKVNAV